MSPAATQHIWLPTSQYLGAPVNVVPHAIPGSAVPASSPASLLPPLPLPLLELPLLLPLLELPLLLPLLEPPLLLPLLELPLLLPLEPPLLLPLLELPLLLPLDPLPLPLPVPGCPDPIVPPSLDDVSPKRVELAAPLHALASAPATTSPMILEACIVASIWVRELEGFSSGVPSLPGGMLREKGSRAQVRDGPWLK